MLSCRLRSQRARLGSLLDNLIENKTVIRAEHWTNPRKYITPLILQFTGVCIRDYISNDIVMVMRFYKTM